MCDGQHMYRVIDLRHIIWSLPINSYNQSPEFYIGNCYLKIQYLIEKISFRLYFSEKAMLYIKRRTYPHASYMHSL